MWKEVGTALFYLSRLLQEHEILYEKKLAKERAAEDDQFGDKDKFVTSAYKKKLAERKAWEEEQRLLDEEDERNDVTKKTDLSGFYKYDTRIDHMFPDSGIHLKSLRVFNSSLVLHTYTNYAQKFVFQGGW